MTHPVQHPDLMRPLPPPPTGPVAPAPRRRVGMRVLAGALGAAVVFGLGFGVAQVIPRSGDNTDTLAAPPATAAPAATSGDTATQNQRLCTAYAIARASKPEPQERALDVLPIATALRVALADNPAAAADIRQAITDVAEADDAWTAAAARVPARGFIQPPAYTEAGIRAAYAAATAVCEAGQ